MHVFQNIGVLSTYVSFQTSRMTLITETTPMHVLHAGLGGGVIYNGRYDPRAKTPGGPLEWQEGVSGSSMDTQKAP